MNSELPESMICRIYEGYGSGGVQILNSELPESIICIMFGGSGPECVQNSNSEHLRGTKYRKIYSKEVTSRKKSNGNTVGRRQRRAGGKLEICNFDCYLTRLEPRRGRRIPVRLRVSRRAALVALVGSGWENEWSRVVQFARNACSWGSKRLSS